MSETARAQSEPFAFQCSQWELIWNSQLIGRYKEMSPGEFYCQWELIWNSKLIGRYKECHQVNLMFETARAQSEIFAFQCSQWELIWNSQLIGRYKEMSPGESDSQWELIWNSQLIGRYKEMSPGESDVWNCQSTEWTLRFSMPSMRAHLKQSTNRKI